MIYYTIDYHILQQSILTISNIFHFSLFIIHLFYYDSFSFASKFSPFCFEQSSVLSSILCDTKHSRCNDIETYTRLHTPNKRTNHEDQKYIHKSHHFPHVRNLLSRDGWRLRFSDRSEFSLKIRKYSSKNSQYNIFGSQQIHTKKMCRNSSILQSVRSHESSTETMKKAI